MELTDQHLKDLLKWTRIDVLNTAGQHIDNPTEHTQKVWEARGADETALVLEAFMRGWTIEQIGDAQNGR